MGWGCLGTPLSPRLMAGQECAFSHLVGPYQVSVPPKSPTSLTLASDVPRPQGTSILEVKLEEGLKDRSESRNPEGQVMVAQF